MRKKLEKLFTLMWYQKKHRCLSYLLMPLSFLFLIIVSVRKKFLLKKIQSQQTKIIVIGNITVGGTGKTPTLLYLACQLAEANKKVAIISRGYGRQINHEAPFEVDQNATVEEAGDEPLMLYLSLAQKGYKNIPIVISDDRKAAISFLEKKSSQKINEAKYDFILSDDGLQHYKMERHFEVVVIDSDRGFGNHYMLPSGPLREPVSRLHSVDHVVINGGAFNKPNKQLPENLPPISQLEFKPEHLWPLSKTEKKSNAIKDFLKTHCSKQIILMAGIGNPDRFFNTIKNIISDLKETTTEYQVELATRNFPDHYSYSLDDFEKIVDDFPHSENLVLMTEKDAVKCLSFAESISVPVYIVEAQTVFTGSLVDDLIKL